MEIARRLAEDGKKKSVIHPNDISIKRATIFTEGRVETIWK